MYVRPNNIGGRPIKLPENYSGNAFSNHSPYSDMPPPTRTTQARETPALEPIRHRETTESAQSEDRVEDFTTDKNIPEIKEEKNASPALPSSSIFSSLLPRSDLSRHFPFGHGIGSEELLILAVMLLVFLSGNERGEIDSEFLLLLGLLLFAG